jgi:cytochrome c biogenesis protein CcmG/thiol:disulfide interchange protein DsbE
MTELQATELQATAPLADDLPPTPEAADSDATKHKKAVRIWQGVIVLILLVFVLLLAARLIQTNKSEQRASGVAPAFTLTTFDGQKISSTDLLGKGVVLNFWASWCDPCRDEAAMLEQTWQREKGNDIVFVGLDYLDQEPAAKAYMAEFGITYPSGPDLQSAAARRYGIKGVPETFFINPQGSITDIVIGPIVSQAKMEEYLAKIRPQ